jgi:hypothetical protein
MSDTGEIGYNPGEREVDCLCGRYPDGDCHQCLSAQAEVRYQENLRVQRENILKEDERGKEAKNEDNKPKKKIKQKYTDSDEWKNFKKKIGVE